MVRKAHSAIAHLCTLCTLCTHCTLCTVRTLRPLSGQRPERTGESVVLEHLLKDFTLRLAPVGRHAVFEPVTRELPEVGHRHNCADRRLRLRRPFRHVV